MLLIFGLLLTFFLGLFLSLLLIKNLHPIGRIGLSWLLGLGIVTLIMTAFLFSGIQLVALNLLLTIFIIDACLFLFLSRKGVLQISPFWQLATQYKLSSIEKVLTAVVVFLILYAVTVSMYWPVKDWDAFTLYDFRAQLIANPLTQASFMQIQYNGYYYGYPLLTSLGHTLVYLLGGTNPLFISGLFYISLILIFYGAVRQKTSRMVSIFATFLVGSNFLFLQHITTAYTNLPFSVYHAMATLYLFLWMSGKEKGYFFVACFLSALSIWVRDSEPFWLANLGVLIIYSILKKKPFFPLIYFMIVMPIRLLWGAFKDKVSDFVTSGQFTKGLSIAVNGLNFDRLVEVTLFLQKAIFPNFLPVVLLFLVFIFLDIKNIFKEQKHYLVLLIIANAAILFVGSYIFSFTFVDWAKIPDSVNRIFMFFPILIIFYAALVLDSLLQNKSNKDII